MTCTKLKREMEYCRPIESFSHTFQTNAILPTSLITILPSFSSFSYSQFYQPIENNNSFGISFLFLAKRF